MLPIVTGLEVCSRLRKEGNKTPILMLTAKAQLEDKILGFNTGADDYLTKPFDFSELLVRIKALARRPKTLTADILVVDDLKLDLLKTKVMRADKEVFLSKREFALLEFLMKNKGRVLSKDQIINHVWEADTDVLENTVEVYVGYLRSKLRLSKDSKQLIKTVRGFGYKIG